ncbi:MAG: hypothetical protein COB60_03585 [Flavobacteriaceae bacterium]|nr:MAG: hypothetical protein COB60_03585 [Flavobacteriaceae bacterium]
MGYTYHKLKRIKSNATLLGVIARRAISMGNTYRNLKRINGNATLLGVIARRATTWQSVCRIVTKNPQTITCSGIFSMAK